MKLYDSMQAVAYKKDMSNLLTDDKYVAAYKWNGERLLAFRDTQGVLLFGRGYSKYGGRMEKTRLHPELCEELLKLPINTCIDGEIVYLDENGREDFIKCREICGSSVNLKDSSMLTYVVWDCLQYAGKELLHKPLIDRRLYLTQVAELVSPTRIKIEKLISATENKQAFLNDTLASGAEGIILKNLYSVYTPGQRPVNHWYKLKKKDSTAGFITGYGAPKRFTDVTENGRKTGEQIESRFYTNGWIGSIQLSQYRNDQIVPVCNISGISDSLRQDISEHKEAYLGMVVEFEFFEKTADSYFHPRFKCFRNDKPKEQCEWNES